MPNAPHTDVPLHRNVPDRRDSIGPQMHVDPVPAPGLHRPFTVGDVVEVRSAAEIVATLDATGRLEGLPFMPEMLQFCGQRFRVFRRADKTCDTISPVAMRRMHSAVHLEGVRCDGQAHGGCQASCLIFWKDAWLKAVSEPQRAASRVAHSPDRANDDQIRDVAECALRSSICRTTSQEPPEYVCQATELQRATTPLPWWDVRQYRSDLVSGNVTIGQFTAGIFRMSYNALLRWMRGVTGGYRVAQIITTLTNGKGQLFPIAGPLSKTPSEQLQLQPGEYVQVRSKEEILRTLDARGRNRGLSFDVEMLPYCGRTCRVLKRVERILDERTGRMRTLPNDCVILEGVVCSGHLSHGRLFCPRSIYPYWREIWLRRVPAPTPADIPVRGGDALEAHVACAYSQDQCHG